MKSKCKYILLFLLLIIIFLLKDIFFLIPLEILKINYYSLSDNLKVLLSIYSSIVVIIIVIIIYKKYLKEKLIDYKKNFSKYFDLGFKTWIFGLVLMSVLNYSIIFLTPSNGANNESLVQDMLRSAPILTFISATFVAPFLEEMLFRKSLYDIFKNKYVKIFMCGFIFGLMHVIFSYTSPLDLLYILPYGALGSAFAYMMCKKNNIFIPITFHMVHNGLLTLISILLRVS